MFRQRRKPGGRESLRSGGSLPDQSHADSILAPRVHQRHHQHDTALEAHGAHEAHVTAHHETAHHETAHHAPNLKSDFRLEIPITLDATLSLSKNKQSLEELLNFVHKNDATLLEAYLKGKTGHPPVYHPPSSQYKLPAVKAPVQPADGEYGLPAMSSGPAHPPQTDYKLPALATSYQPPTLPSYNPPSKLYQQPQLKHKKLTGYAAKGTFNNHIMQI